jgi:hypothetical protein
MSSGTSTDSSTFRPWHLFVLAALMAGTAAVLIIRPTDPAGLILMVLAIGAAALAGLGLYRTLWPLSVAQFSDRTEMVGQRTRAAVEREKTLVLRSIKELEFDRAMGKVSEADFHEMASRLRARAIRLMKQLDQDATGYRDLIEHELRERLKAAETGGQGPGIGDQQIRIGDQGPGIGDRQIGIGDRGPGAGDPKIGIGDQGAPIGDQVRSEAFGPQPLIPEPRSRDEARRACGECGTSNDPDAKFCKACGGKLSG